MTLLFFQVAPSCIPPSSESETVSQLLHSVNQVSGLLRLDPAQADAVYAELIPTLQNAGIGEFSWHSNSVVLNYQERGIDLNTARSVSFAAAAAALAFLFACALWARKRAAFSAFSWKVRLPCCILGFPLAVFLSLWAVKRLLMLDFIHYTYLVVPTAVLLVLSFLLAFISGLLPLRARKAAA